MARRTRRTRGLIALALGLLIGGTAVLVIESSGDAQRRGRNPVIEGAGEAFPIADAALDRGRRRVVIDASEGGEGDAPPPGLARAARLLNIYALHGVPAREVRLTVVLHGDATSAALTDAAHRAHARGPNPHDGLVDRLEAAGAEVVVCGQALVHLGYPRSGVLDGVDVSASAMTTVVDAQLAGAAFLDH